MLVLGRFYLCDVLIISCLHLERDVLEALKVLDAPASLKLVDECAGEDALACAMAEVNESASRYIKSVMPTVWI